MAKHRITLGPTSAGPVVCVEDVAEAAGAVVAPDVVVTVVVAGKFFILSLLALVHICGAGRASHQSLHT